MAETRMETIHRLEAHRRWVQQMVVATQVVAAEGVPGLRYAVEAKPDTVLEIIDTMGKVISSQSIELAALHEKVFQLEDAAEQKK